MKDIIPKFSGKVSIHECELWCHACKSPLDKLPEGVRINRIASLGCELVQAKSAGEKRARLEAGIKDEILKLGGTIDKDGFVRS